MTFHKVLPEQYQTKLVHNNEKPTDFSYYRIYLKKSDRRAKAISVDTDQTAL